MWLNRHPGSIVSPFIGETLVIKPIQAHVPCTEWWSSLCGWEKRSIECNWAKSFNTALPREAPARPTQKGQLGFCPRPAWQVNDFFRYWQVRVTSWVTSAAVSPESPIQKFPYRSCRQLQHWRVPLLHPEGKLFESYRFRDCPSNFLVRFLEPHTSSISQCFNLKLNATQKQNSGFW